MFDFFFHFDQCYYTHHVMNCRTNSEGLSDRFLHTCIYVVMLRNINEANVFSTYIFIYISAFNINNTL